MAEFIAVHPGHQDVGDDHIRDLPPQEIQGLPPIDGKTDVEALLFQDIAQLCGLRPAVLDDEDVKIISSRCIHLLTRSFSCLLPLAIAIPVNTWAILSADTTYCAASSRTASPGIP